MAPCSIFFSSNMPLAHQPYRTSRHSSSANVAAVCATASLRGQLPEMKSCSACIRLQAYGGAVNSSAFGSSSIFKSFVQSTFINNSVFSSKDSVQTSAMSTTGRISYVNHCHLLQLKLSTVCLSHNDAKRILRGSAFLIITKPSTIMYVWESFIQFSQMSNGPLSSSSGSWHCYSRLI